MECVCPVCGRTMPEGMGSCIYCGAKLNQKSNEIQNELARADQPLPFDPAAMGKEEKEPPQGRAPSQRRKRDARSDPKRPSARGPYAMMSPLQYFGSILLMLVPVVGIIVAVFWSLGYCQKENKRNLARAMLALIALFLLLFLILSIVFRPYLGKAFYALFTPDSTPVVSAVPQESPSPDTSNSTAEHEIAGWDPSQPVSFSGFPSANALNLLLGGEYYIKYTIFAYGSTQVREQAKSGGRFAEVETISDRKIRILTMDGVRYECDDEQEIYCIAGQGSEAETLPFGGTLSALERVGSGEGQVNGIDCEYDEFILQGGGTGEMERTVRLYVKDEVLQAIYMEEPLLGGEVMIQVQVLTKDIPEGMLDFPSSYTQVTYDEMVHPGADI